jgi:hypothetical protein
MSKAKDRKAPYSREGLIELSVSVATAATRLFKAKRIDAETRDRIAWAGAEMMGAAAGVGDERSRNENDPRRTP